MMKKKILAALLAAIMVASLCACGAESSTTNSTTSDTSAVAASSVASETESTTTAATITVVDGYGREVEIPTTVERIVPLGNAPRLLTYLGLDDQFVGIPDCEIGMTESANAAYAYGKDWSDLPIVGTDSLGAGEWYAEELIACSPDVIVTTYTADVADDIQRQTGIPTIAVSSSSALFSEEYNDTLTLLGEIFNVSDRAEALVNCINTTIADIEDRTKDIPDDNKPSVLGAGATFKGGHSIDGVYANYPIFEILSAKDVAVGISEQSSGMLVDKEQILQWDPDIIFFDAGSMELVRDDYASDTAYFESLKAVQNGQLYQWPNSTYHSSNVEIPLVSAYYVGTLLYPDAFADVNFEEKAAEIFDLFLGNSDYLQVLEEAGAGYGAVTLQG